MLSCRAYNAVVFLQFVFASRSAATLSLASFFFLFLIDWFLLITEGDTWFYFYFFNKCCFYESDWQLFFPIWYLSRCWMFMSNFCDVCMMLMSVKCYAGLLPVGTRNFMLYQYKKLSLVSRRATGGLLERGRKSIGRRNQMLCTRNCFVPLGALGNTTYS